VRWKPFVVVQSGSARTVRPKRPPESGKAGFPRASVEQGETTPVPGGAGQRTAMGPPATQTGKGLWTGRGKKGPFPAPKSTHLSTRRPDPTKAGAGARVPRPAWPPLHWVGRLAPDRRHL
jgi:hypothetical protein